MTKLDFDRILHRRLGLSEKTLSTKSGEYATPQDRLHNFHRAAEIHAGSPADAVLDFMCKHWISLEDIVQTKKMNPRSVSQELIDEKIGDIVNYLCLLEACLLEGKLPASP